MTLFQSKTTLSEPFSSKKIVLPILSVMIFCLFLHITSAALSDDSTYYFRLDGTSGAVVDEINGNDGTVVGTVTRGFPGIINSSFKTAGAGYVNAIPNTMNWNNTFTVSVWYNTSTAGDEVLFSTGYYSAGAAGNVQHGSTTNDDAWHNVVLASNGNKNFTLYVDGSLIKHQYYSGYAGCWFFYITSGKITASMRSGCGTGDGNLHFAQRPSDLRFTGVLDEIGIWDTNLTAVQVSEIYNSGIGLTYPFIPVLVTLDSPSDSSYTIDDDINFSSTLISTSTLSNATLFVWNSTSLYNISSISVTGESNVTNFTVDNFLPGSYHWNILACNLDATCSYSSSNNTFVQGIRINAISYNATSYDTIPENIIANITYNSGSFNSLIAKLIYNGTTYVGTKTTSGSDTIISRLIYPPAVYSETNISFYWTFDLTNVYGTFQLLSQYYNQTVKPINGSICGSPLTVKFLNFSVIDENTLKALNVSFESNINYGFPELTKSLSYEDSTNNHSSFSFCFDPPDKTLTIDGFIELEATGYESETYTIRKQTATNSSTLFKIYLLNSTSSTSYIIHVRDSAYEDVSQAIVEVERYYPSTSDWKVVESIETNVEGKSIAHLVQEDVNYRFKVYVDDVLVYVSTPTKIFCESTPCTITLTLSGESGSGFNIFEELDNLEHTLTYSGNIFTFSYADTDSTAQGGRIKVYKLDYGTSTNTICDTTSTSTTAVLTCDISGQTNGTYVAVGYINRDGLSNRIVDRIIIRKVSDVVTEIGADGVLWGMFFIIGLVMLGMFRPAIAIVFAIGGFILIAALGIMSIPIVSIISIIIMALIIAWEFRK